MEAATGALVVSAKTLLASNKEAKMPTISFI
jgi:hypothetical protein